MHEAGKCCERGLSRPHPVECIPFAKRTWAKFLALRAQRRRDVRAPSNQLTDSLGKATPCHPLALAVLTAPSTALHGHAEF